MTVISIKVYVGDLSELVGKKLVKVEGDPYQLSLTFEGGATLSITGNDGWNSPVWLDFELSYAHSDDKEA